MNNHSMIATMNPNGQTTSQFQSHQSHQALFSSWNGIMPSIPAQGTALSCTFEQMIPTQQKRTRDGENHLVLEREHQQRHQHCYRHQQDPPSVSETSSEDEVSQSSAGKRSRLNNYRAPQNVKTTLVSVMGSLVGGGRNQSNTQVKLRRQLSASHLDQFMSSDAMEEDLPEQRERSMSF